MDAPNPPLEAPQPTPSPSPVSANNLAAWLDSLFSRARAYQHLTPLERMLLKLLEGLLAAGLVAALPIIADALGQQAIDWGTVLRAALGAFGTAMILALSKYYKAFGDPPLGQ